MSCIRAVRALVYAWRMDIRIEQIDGDPPVWKVFLGTFFIVRNSEEEAVACLETARQYVASHPGVQCFLPHPPAIAPPGDGRLFPHREYLPLVSETASTESSEN